MMKTRAKKHIITNSMKRLFSKTFLMLTLALFWAGDVFAQGNLNNALPNLTKSGQKAGTEGAKDLEVVIGNAIGTALSLVGLIFLVLMVYAGYLWMTARGEEEQVTKARKIIVGSLIGIVIVVSAYAITYLVGASI